MNLASHTVILGEFQFMMISQALNLSKRRGQEITWNPASRDHSVLNQCMEEIRKRGLSLLYLVRRWIRLYIEEMVVDYDGSLSGA
jgi:hypothetical protein